MKNREKKIEVLTNGDYHKYTQTRKNAFKTGNDFELFHVMDDETGEMIYQFNAAAFDGLSEENAIECEHIRNNKNRQRSKIEKHIKFLIKGALQGFCDLFFVTMTFNDKALELKPETRKKSVTKALQQYDDYIVNIDYGGQNGREHFHAIVSVQKSKDEIKPTDNDQYVKLGLLEKYEKRYGFTAIKRIDITDSMTAEKLAKYITKLVLHSVKVNQSYVSVKKGSRYQLYQKLERRVRVFRSDTSRRHRKVSNDYLLKMAYLERGEYSEMFELFGLDFDVASADIEAELSGGYVPLQRSV